MCGEAFKRFLGEATSQLAIKWEAAGGKPLGKSCMDDLERHLRDAFEEHMEEDDDEPEYCDACGQELPE